MDENQRITLDTYEKTVRLYATSTNDRLSPEFATYVDTVLDPMLYSSSILEIGSGTGLVADYIESCGYNVTRSDVVGGFLEYMRDEGAQAVKFDVLQDSLGHTFDLIVAMAVFHHFTYTQFGKALENVKKHLTPGGTFAFYLKQGVGEIYSLDKLDAPRYYLFWEKEFLHAVLTNHDFTVTFLESAQQNKWLQCVAHTT